MYKLYVRSHLDYYDVIYHIPHSICKVSPSVVFTNQMENLDSVQYSSALAVAGAWKGTSHEKLYNELGWESLNLRRRSRRITLFYNIVNNLTPDYTRNPFPHPHKSKLYPDCLFEWERLDLDIRLTSSVIIFKGKLLSIIRPPPESVYRIHEPKGLSILTQLRVGLSKLNFHRFSYNFKETWNPLCAINDGVEDTEHYFLLCHAYDAFRRDLFCSVNAILLFHGIICI